jgi:hypothetical protein
MTMPGESEAPATLHAGIQSNREFTDKHKKKKEEVKGMSIVLRYLDTTENVVTIPSRPPNTALLRYTAESLQ